MTTTYRRLNRVPNAHADRFVNNVRALLQQHAPEVDVEKHCSIGGYVVKWTKEDERVSRIAKKIIDAWHSDLDYPLNCAV